MHFSTAVQVLRVINKVKQEKKSWYCEICRFQRVTAKKPKYCTAAFKHLKMMFWTDSTVSTCHLLTDMALVVEAIKK